MRNKPYPTICFLIILSLALNACATFKKPAAINEAPIRDRAQSKEADGIRASAAVLGDEEAQRIFGIDLARKKIQAVWVEIENKTDRKLGLLPVSIDPEYFAPLEVSFAYHKAFSSGANAELDEYILSLNFPIRRRILPGSRASGYIFTNWTAGMKVIDIDLVGNEFNQNFTFFAPNPDSDKGVELIDQIEKMFTNTDIVNVESEEALRQALEQLPCCVSGEGNGRINEPLNVVIIGALDDWTTAFVRRGFLYHPLKPRYAFGRTQDLSGRKKSIGYIKGQEQFIRLWQTPIQYQKKPVWIGQTSFRVGGRFANDASPEETLPLDPDVDEARLNLTQEMAYSQALVKIGHVKGTDRTAIQTDINVKNEQYNSDGLRVVLLFGSRPASLSSINFFDWEKLADYQ